MDKKPQPQPQSNRPNKPMPAKKNDIKDQYRVNERIRAKEVRLVGDNVEQGVYTIQEAIHMADEQGLDLIEISPNAVPPVDFRLSKVSLSAEKTSERAES